MLADLAPKSLDGHEKCTRETIRSRLSIHAGGDLHQHVTKLVCQCKSFALRPRALFDHDDRNGLAVLATHACREPVDIREIDRQNLNTALFEQFGKIRNWINS